MMEPWQKVYLVKLAFRDRGGDVFLGSRCGRSSADRESKKTSPPRNPKPLFDVFCSYPLTHDFAATICGFLILVDSPSVRNAAKLKMKDFLQRLTNALLNATFVF